MNALRRRWFSDLPVGVERHEYRAYQSAQGLGVVLTVLGALFLLATLTGFFARDAERVERTESVAIAEILAGRHPPGKSVRVSGLLVGDDLPKLPGEAGKPVLAGELVVQIVGSKRGRTARTGDGPAPRLEVDLLEWKEAAPVLRLTDGVNTIELLAPFELLPLRRQQARAKARFEERDGTSVPVAVDYEGLELPVDGQRFARFSSRELRGRAELKILEPNGQVTVVAAPLEREGTMVLGVPQDGAMVVRRGSPEQVARGSTFMSLVLTGLGLAMLAIGIRRLTYARRLYRSFEARTQQR